ncbi:uncharacterized protein LOC131157471 [Malania oleifera]|uniref:uncharacterized protein LOC131157471 n=1 Tax=Malania oleifera TaxID=397392 RepID=UPI0025AE0DF0|nr:uncharacterized protein LOC131157471 [Malania oleifera]
MAEFPPNMEDGELWLPSDIFFPEEVPSNFTPHLSSTQLAYMDHLAQRFARSCVLLQTPTKPPHTFHPNFERFRLPVRFNQGLPQPEQDFSVNGGLQSGPEAYCGSCRPLYPCRSRKPANPQVEGFVGTRARVLERQQNQVQTRFGPFQGSEVGMGGFARESTGTGVFLPRVVNTIPSAAAVARKRQGVRSKQESIVSQQRSGFVGVGLGKQQEECHCQQLPAEIGLPQDWTY